MRSRLVVLSLDVNLQWLGRCGLLFRKSGLLWICGSPLGKPCDCVVSVSRGLRSFPGSEDIVWPISKSKNSVEKSNWPKSSGRKSLVGDVSILALFRLAMYCETFGPRR